MKTTLTQTLKNKVKKAITKYDQIQEELLEQIAASRSNRSLSRFQNEFEKQYAQKTLITTK